MNENGPRIAALKTLGERLEAAAQGEPAARGRRLAPLPRAAVAVSALLALGVAAFVSLTPGGRAIAEDIAGFVGIGGPPTNPPTLGESGVVIGGGEIEGRVYEVVAETNTTPRDTETCFSVRFQELRPANRHRLHCITSEPHTFFDRYPLQPTTELPPQALRPEIGLIVQALVSPEVERAEVTYTARGGKRRSAPAQLWDFDPELAERLGVNDEAGFMVAFLPGPAKGPPSYAARGVYETFNARPRVRYLNPALGGSADVEVVGYDSQGAVVARVGGAQPRGAIGPGIPVGSGEVAGHAYEVAYEVVIRSVDLAGGSKRCFSLRFLNLFSPRQELFHCLGEGRTQRFRGAELRLSPRRPPGPLRRDIGLVVEGLAGSAVAEAEVTYLLPDGKRGTVTAELTALGPRTARKIGISARASFLVAFLPTTIREGITDDAGRRMGARVAVVGYDAAGNVIARKSPLGTR